MYVLGFVDLALSFAAMVMAGITFRRVALVLAVLHVEKDKNGLAFRLGMDGHGKIEGGENRELMIYPGQEL